MTGRVERLEPLTDPNDRRDAMELNFDPDHTFFTKLARPWRSFEPGTRVLLEATEVAVEILSGK